MEKVLTKHLDDPNLSQIETYRFYGGYEGLRKALSMKPDEIIEEVKKSGLRGRGGAGFPTGMKWTFLAKNTGKPIYLCCNADESEPGTFKDRLILEKNPHQLIEGMAIACCAIGAHTAYIYIRGEFFHGARLLQKALDEAYAAGFLGKNILKSSLDLNIFLHRGMGAYICGEETALIQSLEGKKGFPRLKPPFPAVVGLFNCPTIVNNVETLANLPYIVLNGGAQYAQFGTLKSSGTRLFSLSGHVQRPGVYELEMGTPLIDLIEKEGGGVLNGRKLKAVIPGGSSVPVLTEVEVRNIRLDFESMQNAGTMLGSGGVIVMDETTCMVHALSVLARFYKDESCGQCTPCREGTGLVLQILERVDQGEGRLEDIDLLLRLSKYMMGTTICPLADADAMPIQSFITKFRGEFEEHVRGRGCPYDYTHH
jgi:NADH-quinone oxidoreductase subunit F